MRTMPPSTGHFRPQYSASFHPRGLCRYSCGLRLHPAYLHPCLNRIPQKNLGRSPSDQGRVVTMAGNALWRAPENVLLAKVTASFRRSHHSQKADQRISHSTLSFGPSTQHSTTNEPIVEVEALSLCI